MNENTPVLLIDDGDLQPAVDLLEQLGADFERMPGSSARSPVRHPGTLLITTAARAHALRIQRSVTSSEPRATWIVFVSNESTALRSWLQSAGFDFLVRAPVHPAALQLLLQRALYRGAEARRAPRVACGHPVTFKTGFWRRKAMLVDLSPRGCRLLVDKAIKEKSEVSVQIPKTLAGGRALDLMGHVVRVAPAEQECGLKSQVSVGIRFAPIEGETRTRLREVLAERVLGPAVLPPGHAPRIVPESKRLPSPESVPAAADAAAVQDDRPARAHKRARYSKRVTAMEGDDAYIVMCRDISAGGMRIEPIEGLGVGSKLDLAIQLSARDEPFLVEATVTRDDGELGLALKFTWIESASQERLQELVEKQPSIEALQDDTRSQGTVVAQRLPNDG